jgi:hypothetical protein
MPPRFYDDEPPPPATAEQVEAAEAELGGPLPEEHRRFLLQHNGGYVEPNVFADRFAVHQFFSAGESGDDDVRDLVEVRREHDVDGDPTLAIPERCLPFAMDEGGNLYCFDRESDDSVVLWHHDAAEDEDPFEPVAASFGEFWDGLEDDPL